ncbi:uncharacterized protein V6R79_014613 [Siganus canaliculatus]
MNAQSAINKEVFVPRDEQMLVAVEVRRRKRKTMSYLSTGPKEEYKTFLCVSVTSTWPHQLLITKVKQFGDSSSFVRRSQWTVEQLKQVNGINSNKDCPEFDLVFDNTVDQWVASSSAEKCIFVQILYHACQTYWDGKAWNLRKAGKFSKKSHHRRESKHTQLESPPRSGSKTLRSQEKAYSPPRQAEFINCQSKLTGDACNFNLVIYRCKAFLNRIRNRMFADQRSPGQGEPVKRGTRSTVGNIVQRMNMFVEERGDKLCRAEDKTVVLMHKAQQFADTAHKWISFMKACLRRQLERSDAKAVDGH